MRINYKTFWSFTIVFFYLIETHFYKLLKLNNTYVKYVLFSISLIVLGIYICDKSFRRNIKTTTTFFSKYYVALIFLFFIPQLMYVLSTYNQGIVDYLKEAYYYCFVFLCPILLYVFSANKGIKSFLDKITTVVSIGLVINIINSFVYNNTGKLILNVAEKSRDGVLRTYSISSLIGLIAIYTTWRVIYFGKVICMDKNLVLYINKNLIEFTICMVSIFYCYQSRILELVVVALIGFMYLTKRQNSHKKIAVYLAFCAGFILFVNIGGFNQILSSFSLDGDKGGSTYSRLREVAFYIDAFKQNPLFGIGLISPESPVGAILIRGDEGKNYIQDVGYIGLLASVGLTSIPLLLLPYLRMGYILFKCRKFRNEYYNFMQSLLIFMVISGVTLLTVNSGRMLTFVFSLAIFEFLYWQMTSQGYKTIRKKV